MRFGGRLGVRLRSALAAVTVVGLVLAVVGVTFVVLHRRSLTATVHSAASSRAEAVAGQAAAGDAGGFSELVLPRVGDEALVQVIRPDGRVLVASAPIDGEPALSSLRPKPGGTLTEDRRLAPVDDASFHIVAVGVSTRSGDVVVLVAQSLRPVATATATEIGLLAVGYPLVLLLVGGATALLVGRSLRTVEAMRRRVAAITARQLHERVPLPAADDEFRRLAQTMNTMLDRLEDSALAQRRFVADASHELRSPLSTLQVGLELLDARLRSQDRVTVTMLREEAERLARLVADLLLLARVDEHGLAPRFADVDLDDLVDAERSRVAAQPGPRVVAEVRPVRVRGDRSQLARAVRNLVDNAVRHARTTVTLRLLATGDIARLEVADDGPGVPAADRDRIFQRFVRLQDGRERAGGGSGLGLAIVAEIVAGHGGGVTITDAPGGGAAFVLTLPLHGSATAGVETVPRAADGRDR
jgi:signal transduction histidine kinase